MDTGYTDKHRLEYKYRFRFGARKAKTSTATVTVTATATTKAKATVTRSRCSPMYVRTRTGCGWLLTTGTRADRYECRCSEPTTAHTARHSNARGLQCVAVGASETTLLANTANCSHPNERCMRRRRQQQRRRPSSHATGGGGASHRCRRRFRSSALSLLSA